jgi:hypothetical protein
MVRVFALGHARVKKDGGPLDSPDLVKPRELLYYLSSHREGRTKESRSGWPSGRDLHPGYAAASTTPSTSVLRFVSLAY